MSKVVERGDIAANEWAPLLTIGVYARDAEQRLNGSQQIGNVAGFAPFEGHATRLKGGQPLPRRESLVRPREGRALTKLVTTRKTSEQHSQEGIQPQVVEG